VFSPLELNLCSNDWLFADPTTLLYCYVVAGPWALTAGFPSHCRSQNAFLFCLAFCFVGILANTFLKREIQIAIRWNKNEKDSPFGCEGL